MSMAGVPVQAHGVLSVESLAEIFNLSADALLVVSFPEGRMLAVNEAFCQLTGSTREEVTGHLLDELTVWLSQDGRVRLRAVVQRQGRVRNLEVEIGDKAGRQSRGLVSADLVEINGQLCLITLTRDMTSHLLASAQLQASLAELQARNVDLETFAHTVAHDLKSPLNNISGYAEWLLENQDAPLAERLDFLQIIARNADKMGHIINELLLLAQARQDEVELHPLDTNSLVTEALARLAYLVSEQRVTLSLPGAWPTALGYGPWVEEIWVNYLSNAIKYGGYPPQVELGSNLLSNGQVRFWVHDNGPGLSAEAQAHLFAAFGEKSKVRATGSGLGLSIVKQIAEKMGGQVGVESAPGQGSLFYFTLPALE